MDLDTSPFHFNIWPNLLPISQEAQRWCFVPIPSYFFLSFSPSLNFRLNQSPWHFTLPAKLYIHILLSLHNYSKHIKRNQGKKYIYIYINTIRPTCIITKLKQTTHSEIPKRPARRLILQTSLMPKVRIEIIFHMKLTTSLFVIKIGWVSDNSHSPLSLSFLLYTNFKMLIQQTVIGPVL